MTRKNWTRILISVLSVFLLWIIASAALYQPVQEEHVYSPAEGFYAPDFTLTQLSGESFTLSEHLGQPILLTLWASWCAPCKAEMPDFNRVYQEFGNDVLVIGVNVTSQDDPEAVEIFVQQNELSFPILLDLHGEVANLYRLRGLPMTFFIDLDGKINDVIVGGPLSAATVRGMFNELLQER